ncbi:MAG: O-methyltransferase [Muribaculaceae bacterium]|nr:O-methyltransferase [Muribaculaceae bacterium]MDE7457308.1 O-methyltransferase [Muribaculaceae bacterium]
MELDEYIESHIDREPAHLHDLYRRTHLTRLYARMCSGHVQGRLLAMLSKMISPGRVLELGTFTGYSALCLAEGLADDGELHTVEIDDEAEDELLELFASAPGGQRITLHIGDALQTIETLGGEWDLVFIDANKRNYCDYYDLVFPNVRHGGYIIADNTLWDGKVVDPTAHDAQTEGILSFNDMIASDDRVEKVILPIRDGMTIIRKK